MAHNICQEKGRPRTVLIAKKTASVGRNLKIAITTAEIGNIMRGKAVFKIKRWPAVIDLTPPVSELATK
jgi:CheY-specific phosphatase CheX